MEAALLKDCNFEPIDRDKWLALARRTIGEASFEAALVGHTDDGIRIEPIHERAVDGIHLPRANPSLPWRIVQRVDDPDPARANLQAREDIAQGASGLSVVFAGAPNAFGGGIAADPATLAAALEGIPFGRTHIRLDAHLMSRASVDWMIELLGGQHVDPSRLSLSFGIDPGAVLAGTGRLRMSVEALKASLPQSLAHYFAIGVPGVLLEADGRVFHNAGATEAQELGAALASAVWHLRLFEDARQPLVYSVSKIGFALSVDQNQFLSMAKIRAMRMLWARALEACGIEPNPVTIHAETSYRMMTARDAETNILRNTIACFAAATGGADTIAVLPHTIAHGLPDAFARRIARNTQTILAGESHVGFVSDPAAGSGAVQALTGALCEAGWEEFRRIEAEGGILASLEAGALQQRVRQAREARADKLRSGERGIVGTTLYPAEHERPVATLPVTAAEPAQEGTVLCERLAPQRDDECLGESA